MVEKSKNNVIQGTILTKHFINRYSERILGKNHMAKNKVMEDMNYKMNEREKKIFQIFKHSNSVKIPFNGKNQLIIRHNHLITVY